MHTPAARSKQRHQLQLALHLRQTDSRRLAYVFECVNEESLELTTFVGGGWGGGSVYSPSIIKTGHHKTALLENLQVIGNSLPSHIESTLQFRQGHRPGLEQLQQPQTSHCRQSFNDINYFLHCTRASTKTQCTLLTCYFRYWHTSIT